MNFRFFGNGSGIFYAEVWDRQFEKDALTGKLDSLAEAALKSYKSGHCSEI